MRRLPLALVPVLLLSACGDDGTPQDPTNGSTSTGQADSSTGPGPTTVEPTGSTEPTATGLDSTGPTAECGNGIVEEGEECDDQNAVEDDGCSSACMRPFFELWTATYDGGAADEAHHVLFDAEGNLYVLGSSQTTELDTDLWLRQYTADGREGWTWTYDGDAQGDDVGWQMAWLDGDLLIAGGETTTTGSDMLVVRLSVTDRTPVWIQQYDGPGSGPDLADEDHARAVAVDVDGNLLVGGDIAVDGEDRNMLLRKLDPDGNEIWTYTFNHPAYVGYDGAQAVLPDARGDLFVLCASQIGATTIRGLVHHLDANGTELDIGVIDNVQPHHAALAPDANLLVTGLDYQGQDTYDLWLGRYDHDLIQTAVTRYDGSGGGYDDGLGVAVGPSGDVYVTGRTTVAGGGVDVFVARYSPALDVLRWSDTYGSGEASQDDRGRAVAVSDDESRVAVVVIETTFGQGSNISVRMYRNEPMP